MATANSVTKFTPYVNEMFSTESKLSMLTNKDFDWIGAHTVKIYRVDTSGMNNYGRPDTGLNASRFGPVVGLDAVTEEVSFKKDCSLTFTADKLDTDEAAQQLRVATALARQQHEAAVPEVGSYVYGIMSASAGTRPAAVTLTAKNIYTEILRASQALDGTEASETGRVLAMAPAVYVLVRRCRDIITEIDIGNDLCLKGVLVMPDGVDVVKVPAARLPGAFGFLLAHPMATAAPVELEDYRTHQDPPGISGMLVEGRICYDAFVLDNKREALYYQAVTA